MSHPDQERSFWDPAVYHTGNMEACLLFKNQKWFDYSKAWGEKNLWQGAREADNSRWLYKQYGESMQHVLFGDWQICFQTFIDLYNAANDFNETGDVSRWIARAKEVMSYEAYSDANDYWWWADALYMVMPVMTKMYKLTGDTKYLDKMGLNPEQRIKSPIIRKLITIEVSASIFPLWQSDVIMKTVFAHSWICDLIVLYRWSNSS